jgi:glycosyltransferase involved in cell wall biosynthesis
LQEFAGGQGLMKSLKLCMVCPMSLPLFDREYDMQDAAGGAEINIYHLALRLSRMENVEVSVLVDDFGQPDMYFKNNIRLIKLFKREQKRTGFFEKKIAVIKLYSRILKVNSDVFIFTTASSLLGELVLLQQFLKGRKTIFRISSDSNIDVEKFRQKNGLKRYLFYRFGLTHVSAIVSQTQKQSDMLQSGLGIKSRVIENGFLIDIEGKNAGKEHILWVGRCITSKRPLLFTELAKRMPNENFVMIMPVSKESAGAVNFSAKKLLEGVFESINGLDNIKLIDYVPYSDIQEYFDRAKLYVSTSELEGFPNTFIQACTAGTPILSYRINPDGMLDRYGLGYCCRDDADEAVRFIRELNQDAISSHERRLKEYAAKNHNVEDTARKYISLIKEII